MSASHLMIIGKSDNMSSLIGNLNCHKTFGTPTEAPYLIFEGCTGILILHPNAGLDLDEVKVCVNMAKEAGLPFAIAPADKWKYLYPVLLMKGLIPRDPFNEDPATDCVTLQKCAAAYVIEQYLLNRIPIDSKVHAELDRVWGWEVRSTIEDISQARQIAFRVAPFKSPCSELTEHPSPDEIIVPAPEPFNPAVKEYPWETKAKEKPVEVPCEFTVFEKTLVTPLEADPE